MIFINGGEQVEYYADGFRIDSKPDEQLIWRPDGEGGWVF